MKTLGWQPGWYVMISGKPIRGPFKHEETAKESAEQIVRFMPDVANRITIEKL